MSFKRKATNEQLLESYTRLGNIWKVAEEFNMCGQSVHERLLKLNVKLKNRPFSDDEKFFLLENYTAYVLEGKLQELADKLNRTKSLVCREARKYGLTDIKRHKKLLATYRPPKPDYTKRPHPKGFAGKKHSEKTKKIISETSKASAKKLEESGRLPEKVKKMIEAKMSKGNLINHRVKQTWKAGWREIGGKRKYFRSRWEANYARYLQLLKENNKIKEWEHEAKVFWFEGIKRGCVSFLPDFQVTNNDDSQEYHEVKGWMDDRSKTKIRRMSIYFPEVKLTIIDAKWFKANNKTLMPIIKDWEA
jgi:hypothetical protein